MPCPLLTLTGTKNPLRATRGSPSLFADLFHRTALPWFYFTKKVLGRHHSIEQVPDPTNTQKENRNAGEIKQPSWNTFYVFLN